MTFARKIYNSSPPLAITGLIHVVLLIAMLIAAMVDQRLILGINPWIKPMKFATSITIFVWTVAWMLSYLPGKHRVIEWGISSAMILEMIGIAGQSARGVTSHFNQTSVFDTSVFGIMGATIAFNTCLFARLLWLYRMPVPMPAPILWGVRLGGALFLAGSIEGAAMAAYGAHTVGMLDGGPGLPLVNWSTRAGDLRIAHFLGLHGLQLLPLAGWYFERTMPARAIMAVFVLFLGWLVVFALTLMQAMGGRPLMQL